MEIYISKHGTKVTKERNNFIVTTVEKNYTLTADKVDAIILEGECSVTSGVLRLAIEKDIPIVIADNYGNLLGEFFRSAGSKNGKLKKNQYIFFDSDEAFELAKGWIIEKLLTLNKHLESLLKRRKSSLAPLKEIEKHIEKIQKVKGNNKKNRNSIMGYEGSATKIYFSIISDLLDEKWKFPKREHRNAKSPYNIVLNYMLGILYRKIERLLIQEGFDPSVGIIHVEGDKKLPLLYDFIEKYRFIALEETFYLFHKKMITQENFLENDGLILSTDAKNIISEQFHKALSFKGLYEGKYYPIEDVINFEVKNFKKIVLNIDKNENA